MAEKRSCAVCGAEINEEEGMGYLVVVEFPAPLQVCGGCMEAAKTYDGNFGIRCIKREELAWLILRRLRCKLDSCKEKLAPRTDGKFMYFMLTRTPAPYRVPKDGLLKVKTFDQRMHVPSIGCGAYGIALYDRELTPDELWEYDMQAPEYASSTEEEVR